jgi:beta-lactamase superfamily II metal-dependent hydrolase
MALEPTAVEIRMYQVGFGDCFLLSFCYPDTRRHVLIDMGCGSLKPSKDKGDDGDGAEPDVPADDGAIPGPDEQLKRIADHIAGVCGSDGLTAVIATHRHLDHINGFETAVRQGVGTGDAGAKGKKKRAPKEKSGDVIARLNPKLVLQPWTEHPDAAEDATKPPYASSAGPFRMTLANMHAFAAAVTDLARRPPAWMSAGLQEQLRFVGETNVKNLSAVENLIAMGRRDGAVAEWGYHGFATSLGETQLPGVRVHVLGPPTLEQSSDIRKQREKDPNEFWHIAASSPFSGAAAGIDTAPRSMTGAAGNGAVPQDLPPSARWFRDRLERLTGDQLLEIVTILDDEMNNTSLILLFEVCGKKLLFPGDAQIENWNYALERAENAAAMRALLADVDVYKVGHHGSLNATPKQSLWERFSKRGDRKLRTLLTTMAGKHGHEKSNTEVPRRTLLSALEQESTLLNTQSLPRTVGGKLCLGLRVEAGKEPEPFEP